VVQIGPFTFGPGGGRIIWHKKEAIPESWRKWFIAEITKLTGKFKARTPAAELGLDKSLGMDPAQKVAPGLFKGQIPAFRTKDPVSGKTMGIYFLAYPDGAIGVRYKAIPKPPWYQRWLMKFLSGLAWLPSKLMDVGKDIVDWLDDKVCGILDDPAVLAAISAAALGGPAVAAGTAAAYAAAKLVCGPPDQLPPPPPPEMMPPGTLAHFDTKLNAYQVAIPKGLAGFEPTHTITGQTYPTVPAGAVMVGIVGWQNATQTWYKRTWVQGVAAGVVVLGAAVVIKRRRA
jgi:hypothetical protein